MGKAAAQRAPRSTQAPTKRQADALATLTDQVARLTATVTTSQQRIADAEARAEAAERALAVAEGISTPGSRGHVAPVLRRSGMVDSGDMEVGGDGDVVTMATDKVTNRPFLKDRMIESTEVAGEMIVDKEWAANMRFNEEKVVVIVHEEADSKYPEPCISVWNGGRHQLFPRGMEITVARKFLEILARSKPIRYGNVEYVDEAGVRAVKWPRRVSHRYPFTVVRDDNPKGRAWLKKIFLEP